MVDEQPKAHPIEHCVTKICELAARESGDPRAVFQLGYNLGRLSELTGLGREPFWDRWKVPVLDWDQVQLVTLAHELQQIYLVKRPASQESSESRHTERTGS